MDFVAREASHDSVLPVDWPETGSLKMEEETQKILNEVENLQININEVLIDYLSICKMFTTIVRFIAKMTYLN